MSRIVTSETVFRAYAWNVEAPCDQCGKVFGEREMPICTGEKRLDSVRLLCKSCHQGGNLRSYFLRTEEVRLTSGEAKRVLMFHKKLTCNHCDICLNQMTGCDIDHVVPLEQGGPDDPCNMQFLCVSCHNIKTTRERNARIDYDYEKRTGKSRYFNPMGPSYCGYMVPMPPGIRLPRVSEG